LPGNADAVELPTPAARFLGPADRDLLAGMRCSTGAWFEDEVETFIQSRLADYHDWRRPHTDHTITGLELADLGLVAVGSHESDLIRDGGQVVTSTYLECAAVRTDLQGAVLTEVEPLDEDGRPVTSLRPDCESRPSCRRACHGRCVVSPACVRESLLLGLARRRTRRASGLGRVAGKPGPGWSLSRGSVRASAQLRR
jgi:hypothetical protein